MQQTLESLGETYYCELPLLKLLLKPLLRRESNEEKVLKLAENLTSLQVKVLGFFITSLHEKYCQFT